MLFLCSFPFQNSPKNKFSFLRYTTCMQAFCFPLNIWSIYKEKLFISRLFIWTLKKRFLSLVHCTCITTWIHGGGYEVWPVYPGKEGSRDFYKVYWMSLKVWESPHLWNLAGTPQFQNLSVQFPWLQWGFISSWMFSLFAGLAVGRQGMT